MQSLDIEESKSSATKANLGKMATFTLEAHVLLFSFAASLGFLSIGYHLTIFNSASVFLWKGAQWETTFYTFDSICDAIFAFTIFFISGVLSCNKFKFHLYTKLLMLADLMMIFGTVVTFAIFSSHAWAIYLGRFITGEAIALNIAMIPALVREAQFYVSESNFKTEKRTFIIEVLFALGAFIGFASSHILSELGNNNEIPAEGDVAIYVERPDFFTCCALCFIPIVASLGRMGLFIYLGDIKQPQYAPAFTDEGLTENFEEEDDGGALYMIKFKETKSLFKLLQEPYRRRVELCYILIFIQVMSGFVVFLVNPFYIAHYYRVSEVAPDGADIQITTLEFGTIYLIATAAVGFLLTLAKIPRRMIMIGGNGSALLVALTLVVLRFMSSYDYTRILLFLYWFCACIGCGPAMQVYTEEVLPAKGLQFLHSVKWLLIGIIGLISKFALSYSGYIHTPLYAFWFFMGLMACFVIYDLTPETAGVDQKDIAPLFEYQGEGEETHADLTSPPGQHKNFENNMTAISSS